MAQGRSSHSRGLPAGRRTGPCRSWDAVEFSGVARVAIRARVMHRGSTAGRAGMDGTWNHLAGGRRAIIAGVSRHHRLIPEGIPRYGDGIPDSTSGIQGCGLPTSVRGPPRYSGTWPGHVRTYLRDAALVSPGIRHCLPEVQRYMTPGSIARSRGVTGCISGHHRGCRPVSAVDPRRYNRSLPESDTGIPAESPRVGSGPEVVSPEYGSRSGGPIPRNTPEPTSAMRRRPSLAERPGRPTRRSRARRSARPARPRSRPRPSPRPSRYCPSSSAGTG